MLFCSALMLHKWFDIYILCCCNSLHRQMVSMASEHADPPPHSPQTLIHILKVSLKAILFQTPPPLHMHTHIYTQYKLNQFAIRLGRLDRI